MTIGAGKMHRPAAFLGSALALALAGCSGLPRSTPTVAEILPEDGQFPSGQNIAVVDITMNTVSGLPANFAPLAEWAIRDGPPRLPGVQPGDVLNITVFEVGYALFSGNGSAPAQSSSAASGSDYSFPPLRVPEDGVIQLPYAVAMDVTGLSGSQIARLFENRLQGQSQDAQVLVSVEAGPRRSVVLSGDVNAPGRIVLSEDNERLLDAIALASGPSARPADTLVTLTRGNASSSSRLQDIAANSAANVLLAPGDRIELARDVRSITVLGAASSVSEIAFDSAELSLSEALARAGGPDASRADPTGVFIFRQQATGSGDADGDAGGVQPVIYRLSLLDPLSYFAAQNFAMRESDVMLVADARANQFDAFLRMVNALAAPVVTVDVLTR